MVDKILRKSLLARKISWRVSDSAIDLWPKSFNKLDKASYPTRIVKGPRDPLFVFHSTSSRHFMLWDFHL